MSVKTTKAIILTPAPSVHLKINKAVTVRRGISKRSHEKIGDCEQSRGKEKTGELRKTSRSKGDNQKPPQPTSSATFPPTEQNNSIKILAVRILVIYFHL